MLQSKASHDLPLVGEAPTLGGNLALHLAINHGVVTHPHTTLELRTHLLGRLAGVHWANWYRLLLLALRLRKLRREAKLFHLPLQFVRTRLQGKGTGRRGQKQ